MVLTGKVSRELVGLINAHGPLAVGLSGEDAALFSAIQRKPLIDGKPTDIGLVGDVVGVAASAVIDLINAGRIPVVSSVAPNEDDATEVLTVNADSGAAALAPALGAHKLVIPTPRPGSIRSTPVASPSSRRSPRPRPTPPRRSTSTPSLPRPRLLPRSARTSSASSRMWTAWTRTGQTAMRSSAASASRTCATCCQTSNRSGADRWSLASAP